MDKDAKAKDKSSKKDGEKAIVSKNSKLIKKQEAQEAAELKKKKDTHRK